MVDVEPEFEWIAPTAVLDTPSTPVQAEIITPPRVTGDEKLASTTRTLSPVVTRSSNASGKFWTFVATSVATVRPPALNVSTGRYVLPTNFWLVRWSLTPVMLDVPAQKKVATIASPRCGLTGLKPFLMIVMPGAGTDPSRPFCRSRSEEHTSELQSLAYLVCRLLLE